MNRVYTSFSGETEIVEIGSAREKEIKKFLNDAGLYEDDDPYKPDDCLTQKEFEIFLQKEKNKTVEERYQEYINRKNNK